MENNFQIQSIKRNLPRDVFLHLFAMVTLYWSAVSFITLCWQYVNYFFPDALNYGYNNTGSTRFAVASLFIVFPLFILSSWFLNKIYTKESVVRESKIRKWLIYLTLFVAALVIVGDLIYVINTFLGGEITVRFILKAISVLVVAIVIFWYYLDDVRRTTSSIYAKYIAIITSIVIVVAIIFAFFIVGSPMKARSVQFDQQRINDLQNIQWQVVNYWQRKGQLPQNLADLNDSISGYLTPNDPQTNMPYEYTIKNAANLDFQLCATFNLDSKTQSGIKPMAPYPIYDEMNFQNWEHSAGKTCFERNIDKELYPLGTINNPSKIVKNTSKDACTPIMEQINVEVNNAQKCSIDSDCSIDVMPVPCTVTICSAGYNKNYNLGKLAELNKNYSENSCEQNCPVYECQYTQNLASKCINGKCFISKQD